MDRNRAVATRDDVVEYGVGAGGFNEGLCLPDSLQGMVDIDPGQAKDGLGCS